ncbi:MAG: uracil-DNA glycosylase family protein [Ktedonobacterales bacterium]
MMRADANVLSASASAGLIPVPAPLPPDEHRAERERMLDELHERIRTCTRCVVAGYLARNTSIAGFRGRVSDRIMLVGQAPGHLSVERGQPFAGPGGRMLDGWLQRAGFAPGALWSAVYLSAMTKCDPGKHPRGGGDRKPSPAELALCRPFLIAELDLVRPRVIVPLGGMAIEAFLGPRKLHAVIGQAYERNGVKLLPLPHPSGVSRWLNAPQHQALLTDALEILASWRRSWAAAAMDAAARGGD